MAIRWCKTHKTFVYIYMKHLILTRVRSADPHMTLYSSLCIKKVYKQTWKIKKWDQFLERLIPPCRSFFPLLAEFPSAAWVLNTSTYLPWLLRFVREGAQGGAPLRYSNRHRWPSIDGANSLSWSFIGIPRKPSYSASFSPLIFPTTLSVSNLSIYL